MNDQFKNNLWLYEITRNLIQLIVIVLSIFMFLFYTMLGRMGQFISTAVFFIIIKYMFDIYSKFFKDEEKNDKAKY